jgi:AcrR family transcriptional regulator
MPKGFSEREKEIIRARLMEAGTDHFSSFGIRKTNIEDLTRAAGISKGAFYLFFGSKEELFFDIVEKIEREFRQRITREIEEQQGTPQERFKAVLKKAFLAWRSYPILSRMGQEEYLYLVRKLPEEKVQAHFQSDNQFIAQLLENLAESGIRIDKDPDFVSGLMKALFFASLHEQEIGQDVFPEVLDVLVDLAAGYLVGSDPEGKATSGNEIILKAQS